MIKQERQLGGYRKCWSLNGINATAHVSIGDRKKAYLFLKEKARLQLPHSQGMKLPLGANWRGVFSCCLLCQEER